MVMTAALKFVFIFLRKRTDSSAACIAAYQMFTEAGGDIKVDDLGLHEFSKGLRFVYVVASLHSCPKLLPNHRLYD